MPIHFHLICITSKCTLIAQCEKTEKKTQNNSNNSIINWSKEFNFYTCVFHSNLLYSISRTMIFQWCTLSYLTFYSQSMKPSFYAASHTCFIFSLCNKRNSAMKWIFWSFFHFCFLLCIILFITFCSLFFRLLFVCFCIVQLRSVELDWKYHGLIKPTPFVNSIRFLFP